MRGLRKPEGEKFEKFFTVVQTRALAEDSTFFLFAGEGNEAETAEMMIMDLSGWKIPNSQADCFEHLWKGHSKVSELEEWDSFFTFALWTGEVAAPQISFQQF